MLVEHNVFNAGGTLSERQQHTANRLRQLLFNWYADEEREGRQHTRVQQFTTEMIFGDVIGTWGSETNAVLLWSQTLLARFASQLPEELRRNLVRGVHSAVGIYQFCADSVGCSTSPSAAQDGLAQISTSSVVA